MSFLVNEKVEKMRKMIFLVNEKAFFTLTNHFLRLESVYFIVDCSNH
jgi:hypothetical protein